MYKKTITTKTQTSSSSSSSGIGILGILWYLVIPIALVYFNKVSVDAAGEALVLIIWLIILTIFSIFTLIGFGIFFFWVHPYLTGFISTAGLEGVLGIYFFLYFLLSLVITIVIVGIIIFIIYAAITS